MAQGVVDLIHPGHLHYLEESAALGDELSVVIARDSRVAERKDLVMDERERRRLVEALAVVDEAVLGTEDDIYDILAEIDPDVVTIGYDQPYDTDEIERQQAERGFADVTVSRIGEYEPEDWETVSSSEIKRRLRGRQDP
jgi:FAD synthetase